MLTPNSRHGRDAAWDRVKKPEAESESQAPRDRLIRMSQASLRLNEGLGSGIVLPSERPDRPPRLCRSLR